MTTLGRGSGKVGVARLGDEGEELGDEGEELAELLVSLESIAARLVHRADRVGTRGLPDQLLQRHQVLAIGLLRMLP